jgi:type II secretory pathway pseudopilin PulG
MSRVMPARPRLRAALRVRLTTRARRRGYSYLAVLFLVALTAAGLAALGKAWSTAAQRDRERELEFRGTAIANAIASYQRAGNTPSPQLPRTLDDLLEDRRGVTVRHHLRQRYVDPFTGEADWELVSHQAVPEMGAQGQPPGQSPGQATGPLSTDKIRFNAVRSRSDQPLLRELTPDGTPLHKASDWLFNAPVADGSPAMPQPGASAPVVPTSPFAPAVPAAASAPP